MKKTVLLVLLLVLFSVSSLAAAEKTIVEKIILSEQAKTIHTSLQQAETEMQSLQDKGLPITRYNDTLFLAKQIYDSQVYSEKSGGKADYGIVETKLTELAEIKRQAFLALDELKALELAINQTTDIDTKPVLEIYQVAQTNFKEERYEESLEYVNKAYEKISELEALDTKVKALYDATTRSIGNFFKNNWKIISIICGAVLLFVLLVYNRFTHWRIIRQIESLEQRKKSITELIAKTQRDYLNKGKISETDYKIRTKKYGEMIRDINRQIPLLNEALALRKKKSLKATKK